MDIKIKFEPGDYCFCIYKNSIITAKIVEVEIKLTATNPMTVEYTLYEVHKLINIGVYPEENVFETKQLLIKSL